MDKIEFIKRLSNEQFKLFISKLDYKCAYLISAHKNYFNSFHECKKWNFDMFSSEEMRLINSLIDKFIELENMNLSPEQFATLWKLLV